MKTVEIYILGEKIDLFEDTKVATTFQTPPIGGVDDILMSFTKTIKVPRTGRNAKILGFSDMFVSNETHAYRKLPATVRRNGVEILSGGFAVIKSFKGSYDINIFGGGFGLFKEVGDISLQELDLADLDHDRDLATIGDSTFDGAAKDYDYMYPLIQWGTDVTVQYLSWIIDVERLYPCILASRIMEQIIEDAGYVLKTNLNDIAAPFGDTLIPVMNKLADDNTGVQYANCLAKFTEDTVMEYFVYHNYRWIVLFDDQSSFKSWQMEDVTMAAWASFDYTRFNIQSRGLYEIDVKITFANTHEDRYWVRLVVFLTHPWDTESPHNSVYQVLAQGYVDVTGEVSPPEEVSYSSVEFTFEGMLGRGERVALVVSREEEGEEEPPYIHWGYDQSYVNFVEVTDADTAEYGFNFPIAINLPNISQVDFMKDIAARCGLMYHTNPMTREFHIYTLDDVYDNIANNSIDWSAKLDLSKTPKIKYSDRRYARYNTYKNAKDDTVPEGLGNWFFEIDDENLPKEKRMFQSKFAASDMFIWFPELWIAEILRYTKVEEDSDPEVKPRIVMLRSRMLAASLEYRSVLEDDNHTTVGGLEYVAYAAFTDYLYLSNPNLTFRYSINNFYERFTAMMDKYKEVTANFLLSEVDLANIQPHYPKYVREFGAYFYVKKINNSTGGSDSVELIKL